MTSSSMKACVLWEMWMLLKWCVLDGGARLHQGILTNDSGNDVVILLMVQKPFQPVEGKVVDPIIYVGF